MRSFAAPLSILLGSLALAACEDATLEGRLAATVTADVPNVRVDLFDVDAVEVSLVEAGRVIGRQPQVAPALAVTRGGGELHLSFKEGIPDDRELVLVAWADADADGKLDVDTAGRSEVARTLGKDGDLLVSVASASDHWRGTLRSLAGTRALLEGGLEGWSATVAVSFEGPPLIDSDDDGVDDDTERALGTDPRSSDSDGDGMLDGVELGDTSSPADLDEDGRLDALESDDVDEDADGASAQQDEDDLDPCVPSNDQCDSDEDGLSDGYEGSLGTDGYDPDTDGDGALDGDEDMDSDGDGKSDALERDDTDADGDGTEDELDPDDANPCVPLMIPGCDGDPPPPP